MNINLTDGVRVSQDELRDTEGLGWAPASEGIWFKLVKVLAADTGWVSLLRLSAGTVVGPHRHSGEVHGFQLSGRRRLADGRICGPGTYVYEPAGNIDSWSATDESDMVSLFVVRGSVEYLSASGEVVFQETAASKRSSWQAFRAAAPTESQPR
jgi:quercetin dioxygenase-like cupin family protein